MRYMPKLKIRSIVRARPGHELVAFDLSQAESWVVAYEANEPTMKRALQFGDIHSETACAIFHEDKVGCEHKWASAGDDKLCDVCQVLILYGERYSGKKTNHATAYGEEAPMLMVSINKESDKPPYITIDIHQAKRYNTAWHNLYNIKSWWDHLQYELQQTRTLTNTYGRRRMFFQQWGNSLFKEAYAFKPQSTVADHFNGAIHPQLGIKGGFKELYNRHVTRGYYTIINHAHDSLLLHIPKPVSEDLIYEIRSILERPMVINNEQFTIPVDGERGERFGELEKINWKKVA